MKISQFFRIYYFQNCGIGLDEERDSRVSIKNSSGLKDALVTAFKHGYVVAHSVPGAPPYNQEAGDAAAEEWWRGIETGLEEQNVKVS